MKSTIIPVLLTAILAGLLPVPSCAESMVVQWEKIYNGLGNGLDRAHDLAVDGEGNVVVTGESDGSTGKSDVYTAKYAASDGRLLWQRRYNGPANSWDGGERLALDTEGNVIVTGYSYSAHPDIYTAKYAAANGALLWERRYNSPSDGYDYVGGMALDSAGDVIVTGFAGDYYTAKYASSNGALLWQKFYTSNGRIGTPYEHAFVAFDLSDNVIVARKKYRVINGEEIYTGNIEKYAAATGALLWSAPQDYAVSGLVMDSAGNVLITGVVFEVNNIHTIRTAKYAAIDGMLVWDESYDLTAGNNFALSTIKLDGNGDAVITGISHDPAPNFRIYNSVKYAGADGQLVGQDQTRFSFPANLLDVKVDGAGNLFVTGYYYSSGGNHDIFTAKYASGSGALLWDMRYNGTGNRNDYGDKLLVDRSGSVIVIGRTSTEPGGTVGSDYYTVKYSPVDLDLDDDGLLDSWETAHFGSTAGQSALDDSDGDGAVELLELAFGTDPLKPNAGAGPAVVVEGGYLTTTITKQPGVTYLVQTSATPGAGFSATGTTVLADTASTLKVRDNVLIGTQPARFLRVQVTAAP